MKKKIRLVIALVMSVSLSAAFAGPNPTNHGAPGGGTNTPPVCSTNLPPSNGTNTPPVCPTNTLPNMGTNAPPTNSPPELGTNAATALAARAAVLYAAIVPYDTNADGVLNSSEQAALIEALTNGLVPIFGTNHTFIVPAGEATNCAAWIATLYAEIATFDVNNNEVLDTTEQAALAAALEADTVPLPLFAPLLFDDAHHASLAAPASWQLMAQASGSGGRLIWRTVVAEPSIPTDERQHPQPARQS